MIIDKILVILGEPNSVFSEILFKFFVSNKFKYFKKKVILIVSEKIFVKQ